MDEARALRVTTVVVVAVVIVEAAVSIAARWPHHFGGTGDPNHMVGDFVTNGTALAPPLFLIVLLGLLAAGMFAGGRWRSVATVLMVPLAAVLFVGAMGELVESSASEPIGVRVGGGVLGVGLSLLLLVLAVATLVTGHRRQRAGEEARPAAGDTRVTT